MLKEARTDQKLLLHAFSLLTLAKSMTEHYENQFRLASKYVHATSRGHEAVQIAAGLLLNKSDFIWTYYRDDALLLALEITPRELMLQLMAKKDDPFSGGRTYYAHPSLNKKSRPKLVHSSAATGMQAIPATGGAMGIQYKEQRKLLTTREKEDKAIAFCSLGDAAMTEGEVSEALQMAALKQLPILYLVQDNGWDISATASETRAMNAFEYAAGFPSIRAMTIDGSDFNEAYVKLDEAFTYCREERRPVLVHAHVPLLNHHTSGVRMEWYRDDLEEHKLRDPYIFLKALLLEENVDPAHLDRIEAESQSTIKSLFQQIIQAPEPDPDDLYTHIFAETPIESETGTRHPENGEEKVMVDCALWAINEIMEDHPECLFYGQDVGRRLGGVFRESALLAKKYGDDRVFNTAIQEAFIIGSTVGMSAVGLKPIVEVQFADYIWPGINQLVSEVSKSSYLSVGQWPVSMVLRVPAGAYTGGGPYHSASVESVLTNIGGLKIVYPSNGADLKGLMKSAFFDPNPVVILEHKGLYWSKNPGTENAKAIMPSKDYILPIGKGRMISEVSQSNKFENPRLLIVTYGMGVHWALAASKQFPDQISILDLRSLVPLDDELVYSQAKIHHRILVLTEEPERFSFARSLASRIQENCFEHLDAPVMTLGSANVPCVPLNLEMEAAYLPSNKEIEDKIAEMLAY